MLNTVLIIGKLVGHALLTVGVGVGVTLQGVVVAAGIVGVGVGKVILHGYLAIQVLQFL